MTNSELIKKLQALPANMEVMLIQTDCEHETSAVEVVQVQTITFGASDVPRKEWADVECIIISDY